MTVARRARTVGNFGSLGANKVALEPGEVMPKLLMTSASVIYNGKETKIWNGRKWLQKEFPARRGEDCTIKFTMEGTGKTLVGATFLHDYSTPNALFVRRVSAGEHYATFQVPFSKLPGFKFFIGNKMHDKVDFRFLSNKEKKGLTDNMLLLSDTNNFYETERLGGFSGLGSGHSGMTADYHPSFVKSADTNPKKTASGLNELWSGSLSKHRWKKHGYSGKKEAGRSSAKGEAAVEGPWYVADKSGYYAFRGSTYQMRYDKNGRMIGYDAMEKLSRGMPAGVPIAMVMQYFVHDQEGTAGLFAGIGSPTYSQLGDKRRGLKKLHSHTLEKGLEKVGKATVATLEFVGDAAVDTGEAAVNLAKDPSWENAAAIVTAPLGMNSQWHYADDVTISGSKMFLVDQNVFYGSGDSSTFDRPKDSKGLVTTYADSSAIPYRVDKSPNIKPTFKHNGKTFKKKDFALNVEWYNPKTRKWSSPMKSPPFNFKTDSKGKIKIIFRVPRQLDPSADRREIQQGIENGYPDYSWTRSVIRQAYPTFTKKDGGRKEFRLLGRYEGKDSKTEGKVRFTTRIGGRDYQGVRSIQAVLYCDPPSHWRSGLTYPSGTASMDTLNAFSIHVADPAKFTYLDNPEMDFSYYVDGELKPGSTVVGVGKALGSINSNNAILTTRGFVNGIPSEELGRKEPAGDTPAWVSSNVIKPNSFQPRTKTGLEGTNRADFLEFAGHITTNDLQDNIKVPGEEVLRETWKNIFGVDLTVDWFNKMQITGHDPKDPTNYLIKGSMGETYSFPFSIVWFQIPPYYTGPYLDYNEEGQLQQIEGKPYALASETDPLFFTTTTPFGKLMQQKFDVVAETTEQKYLEQEGFKPDEVLAINDMNYDAEDMTEVADLDAREREFLERTGQTHPMDKPPNMRRYARDWFAANYVYNNPDVVMKPVSNPPVASMSGFSNQSNFYVEDVTDKWGTLNGFSGEVPVDDLNIMPVGLEYEEDENTPFIGFAGLGSGWDTFEDNAVKGAKVFGKMTAEFGKQQVKGIADLNMEEKLTFGALALGAGVTLGIIAYAGTKGTLSGLGSAFKGYGAGRARVISAKARAKERKLEAKYEGKERIIDAKSRAREKKGGAIAGLFSKGSASAS